MKERIWTFSNVLSLVRALLAIPIAKLLLENSSASRAYVVVLLLVAAFTDLFDGMIARRMNQVTEFGKIVDPLADKIAVGTVAVILALQGKLPPWFLALVVLRDLLILLGGMYVRKMRGIILQSNQIGKWTVTAVAFYVLLVVLDWRELLWPKQFLIVLSSILLVISFVLYLRRFLEVLRFSQTGA